MSTQDSKPSKRPGQTEEEFRQFRANPSQPQAGQIRKSNVLPHQPSNKEADRIRQHNVQPQPEAGQIRRKEIRRFEPAEAAQQSERIRKHNAEPRQQHSTQRNNPADQEAVLSADEVERIINYVEQEYGAEVSSEVRKVVREEISSAVPELTRVLLPLFTADEESGDVPNSEKIQHECVKAFLHILVPHMQRIVRSIQ